MKVGGNSPDVNMVQKIFHVIDGPGAAGRKGDDFSDIGVVEVGDSGSGKQAGFEDISDG